MPCPVAQPCIGHIRGSKGWRSGESARLPPMWPGFKSRCRRHTWVEFVVAWFSPLLREVFLRVLQFPPFLKNQHFQIPGKFQFDQESGR